ncbi:hypothetical protein GF351_00260 [Candidatus Woesearchaeota archaeon]|nr:hypothetical protein [Candidatus Woesearchaeota archaeon]
MKESLCICGGHVVWKKEPVKIKGKDFGELEVGRCDRCGAKFLHNKTMNMIEHKLKESQEGNIYEY